MDQHKSKPIPIPKKNIKHQPVKYDMDWYYDGKRQSYEQDTLDDKYDLDYYKLLGSSCTIF